MIQRLLNLSRECLTTFFDELDVESFEKIVTLCLEAKGTLFFSGIGKSGFIASKIAMTLASCGIKSFFLDPLNLLHGDLGIVASSDIVIMISKSGHTKELLELIPHIKSRGALLIGCVSEKNSALQKQSDASIYLPVKKELDKHNLVPTTSTQVQLIFGDVLTAALMERKAVSLELYATLHPAGSIGKKLLTKVEELMLEEALVPFCDPQDSIKDVLVELTSKKCGCVVVIDQKKSLQGIFTDGDLRRSLQQVGIKALDMKVGELMSQRPKSICKNITAFEAKKAMQVDEKSWINVLPIVEQDQVVGLLRLHDILKAGI